MSDQILVKFKKGSAADIPSEINEGTLYVTIDEKGLYLDVTNTERIRINEPIQSDLSQTDAAAADYVNGVIRKESLPDGYPYKEETVNRIPIIEETELTGGTNNGKLVKFETVPTLKGLEAGKLYEFSINGKKQTMECTTAFIPDKYVNQIQVAGVFSAIEVTSGSVDIRIYTDDTTLTSVQFSLYEVEEKTTIHTMAPEFLPYEYAQVSYVDEQLSTQLATKQNTLTITDDGNGNVVIS